MKQILAGLIMIVGIFANAENIKLVAVQNIQVEPEQRVLPGLGYYFRSSTGEVISRCDMSFEPKPYKRKITKNAVFTLSTANVKRYLSPEMTRAEMEDLYNSLIGHARGVRLADDIVTVQDFKNYLNAELLDEAGPTVDFFDYTSEHKITSEKTENSFTLKCRTKFDAAIGLKELLIMLEEGGILIPANDM